MSLNAPSAVSCDDNASTESQVITDGKLWQYSATLHNTAKHSVAHTGV